MTAVDGNSIAHCEMVAECEAKVNKDQRRDATRPSFSLKKLHQENPGLASHFMWQETSPFPEARPLWLHLGCGARVFDGFVNMDLYPQDPRVVRWNLLDLWPIGPLLRVEGIVAENLINHFFYEEQVYFLCNVNRTLKSGGIALLSTPDLSNFIRNTFQFRPIEEDYFYATYGTETGADALNYAMRFAGHRWIHDAPSLTHMASICGFHVTETDREASAIRNLKGLDLRNEDGSVSLTLIKERHISRLLIWPTLVRDAEIIEEIGLGASLFVSTATRPLIEYQLPNPMDSDSILCMNFRSSNMSSFVWGLKQLLIDEVGRPWCFDETLKSEPWMNVITKAQLSRSLGGSQQCHKFRFSPACSIGEFFTAGPAELFYVRT